MSKYREHIVITQSGGKVNAEKRVIDRRGAIRASVMEAAIVISLDESEYHSVYRNGHETLERFDGVYLGKHAEFLPILGWVS